MVDGLDFEAVVRDCELETNRDAYPAEFPALPPIPAARYVDPAFFQLERDHVWAKSWLLAAHESDVAQLGDYRLIEKLGESIIVVRSADGTVRAMHNVCIDRGSPMVKGPRGNVRNFVCRYHAGRPTAALAKSPRPRYFA